MTPTAVAFDALTTLAGTEIGPSTWKRVEQTRIDTFADATDDHQWIHTDPDRAKAGPYAGTIAHGFLTLSLCAAFLGELVEVTGASWGINYGLDRVRFPAPLPVGRQVRSHLSVLSAEETSDTVIQVVYRHVIEVRDDDKPACVADMIVRYGQ